MDGRNAWLRIYWGANWLASDVQSKERGAGARASSDLLGRYWLS